MESKKISGRIRYLTLAIIAIVLGVIVHGAKESINYKNQQLKSSYQAKIEYFNSNNIFYDPKATVHWLSARQHPEGYFVANPDVMEEPSQLNKNSLQSTRHAILTLYRLDGLWDIDQDATIHFVGKHYKTQVDENGNTVAGFFSAVGEPLGIRPTMDALMVLWRLNAFNGAKYNLPQIKQFILNHQNADGGFWDPYYSKSNTASCMRCTSFALTALGAINTNLGETFTPEFKNKTRKFITSTWDEQKQSYASTIGASADDAYDIFRAYLSLSIMSQGTLEQRISAASQQLKLEPLLSTIEKQFITSDGAFSAKYGSNNSSMKATHLLLWFYNDLNLLDRLDQNAIVKYVLSKQTSPGEYGGDIYNTYSATGILKRLDISTRALIEPKEPQYLNSFVPDFLPYALYFLATLMVLLYYLQNKKQLESEAKILERKVKRDSLTGLYNRMYLESYYHSLSTENLDLSLILIDVDHFKQINDTKGHLIGDETLKSISSTISKNTRSNDVVARWGGEEFAILCKDTTLSEAVTFAEELRKIIEATQFEHTENLTCSFGVTAQMSTDTFNSLFERADQAMYLSKDSGRNKVSDK